MSNGVLHPDEVCHITDKLEISPSKSSPGDIHVGKSPTDAEKGKSGASGVESGFKMKPNGHKGPRR
jgi:hypothetical protein